jgi:1-acyl-sn-glycerol-3-phosphate acyltransferase
MPVVAGGELNRWWRVGLPIAAPLVRIWFRVRVVGVEHVPLNGPAILAFNHVSALDGPILAIELARSIKRESRFLVAAGFFRRRVIGTILRRYDQIPINRGEGDASAIEAALAAVKDGGVLAIAPEGTVNGDPATLLRIRSGVARIALPTGAPVIPAAIWGTQQRSSRRGWHFGRPLRPRLALVFGPPLLPVGDLEDAADVETFLARIRDRLETQVVDARAVVEG